jgi:serine/threonine protein kinase
MSRRFEVPSTPIGGYQPLSVLGNGAFAVVYQGRHILTQCEVAIKAIHQSEQDPTSTLIEREVSIMKMLDHPFVICLFDICRDDHHLYLVTELAPGGTLLSMIKDRGRLSEHESRRIFRELMLAIQYLHEEMCVCHRDIKAENILMDENGHIRLSDFGFSRTYDLDALMKTSCGSPPYIAPEVISSMGYTAASDIWSAGVVLYAMVTGRMPFMGTSTPHLFAAILNDEPNYPSGVSQEFLDLAQGLFKKDPAQRFTVPEIMSHPWLAGVVLIGEEIPANLRIYPERQLDEVVMAQMNALNLETTRLFADLRQGEIHKGTAVYKMLRRERHRDELREWEETRMGRKWRIPLGEKTPHSSSYGSHAKPLPLPGAFMMAGKPKGEVGPRRAGLVKPRVRKLGLPVISGSMVWKRPDEPKWVTDL